MSAADPAARALAVHAAVDPLFAATSTTGGRACRSGCAPCCHFPVGVAYAEAVRLARVVAADPGLRARVLAEAERTARMPWSDLVGQPCPLLDSGPLAIGVDGVRGRDARCVAYPQRPLACRALASADADACAGALRGAVVVPRDEVAFYRGVGACAVLGSEHPAGLRELRSALAELLGERSDASTVEAAGDGAAAVAFGRARSVG